MFDVVPSKHLCSEQLHYLQGSLAGSWGTATQTSPVQAKADQSTDWRFTSRRCAGCRGLAIPAVEIVSSQGIF